MLGTFVEGSEEPEVEVRPLSEEEIAKVLEKKGDETEASLKQRVLLGVWKRLQLEVQQKDAVVVVSSKGVEEHQVDKDQGADPES